jgi:hypothetical protein
MAGARDLFGARTLAVLVSMAVGLSASLAGAQRFATYSLSARSETSTPTCEDGEFYEQDSGVCECDLGHSRDKAGACRELASAGDSDLSDFTSTNGSSGSSEVGSTSSPPPTVQLGASLTLDAALGAEYQIVTDTRLAVQGPAEGAPLVVDATPKSFEDWDTLFEYAKIHLGATLIRDDDGEVIAATGRYTRTGNVVFEDAGEEFEQLDYVAAHLGGLSGEIEVAGEWLALTAGASGTEDSVLFATDDTEEVCDATGENCVEGHSWVTHRVIYHSVGARTKQTVGGYETVTTYTCTSGEIVWHEGRRQCRIYNRDAWEFDKELKEWVPSSLDEEPYSYGPMQPRYHQALRNELRVGARVLFGPNSARNVQPAIKPNTRKVEIGDWTIIRNVLPDEFGNTIPIAGITGVCGSHSSDKGGFTLSSDGSTGDEDVLCEGGLPY